MSTPPVTNGRSAAVTATKRPRRKRDPQSTREAILEAARQQLSQDGKEGVSVAQVAQRAGVNRGTAYQHFQTREQLIEATAAWVSDKLYRSVFGDPAVAAEPPLDSGNIRAVTEHLAEFAMENPEIGRVWLFELLSSRRPTNDPFWQQYVSNFERFAKSNLAQPGIDCRGRVRAAACGRISLAGVGTSSCAQRQGAPADGKTILSRSAAAMSSWNSQARKIC
jgi:AcrR family transcriptional regulator